MGITNANIKKLKNGWKRKRESRKEMAYVNTYDNNFKIIGYF
jgi:hypothetical protein